MAVTATQVQNLYLAYFGRPAEPAGLTYWTAQTSATVDQISAAFAVQPEYTATYGNLTRAQTINTLYQNLFGRAAQSNELAYWNNSTDVSISKLALALTNGATGTDRLTLDNKVQFATSVTTASASTASVQDVNSLFNQSVTINGTTYTSVGAYVAATATATSGVSAAQAAAQYYAAANTSLQAIINPTLNGASTGFNADFKAQTAGTIKLDGAVGPDAVIIGANATSNKATSVAFTGNTNGAETLTLTEASTTKIVDTLTFNVSSIDTSTTAANKVLTLVATDLTALKTIDASASSVGFASDVSALANLSSLKTGAGADTLTVATTAGSAVALTVDTGAGNDNVTATVGSAALTVSTGDGVDVLTLTTGNANLTANAGAGNDLVTLNAVASTAGTTHTAVIDLGAGNDTLKLGTFTNLHANETATLLAQDLIKVSNFGTADKLDLSGVADTYQALTSQGAADVAAASNLFAAATAAANSVTAAANNGGNATAHVTSFQFGGNTYVLHADATANLGAGDGLIELTGFQGSFASTVGATGVLTAA